MVAAIVAAAAGSVAAAGAAPATPGPSFVPGHLIVEWQPGVPGSERADGRDDADTTIVRALGSPRFQLVHVDAGHTTSGALRVLRADPRVRSAQRDVYETPQSLPNDPLLGQLWGLTDIGAPAAWDRTVGTPTTVVADIDTGYRSNHEDLGSRAWTNPGETAGDGIDNDGDGIADDVHGADFVGSEADSPTVDGDPTDDDPVGGGHGVHTAGTIGAAGNNGVGVTGVAQNVRIMALRICAHSTSVNDVRCPASAEISAINYAGAHGARVANMSLGGTVAVDAIRDAMAANPGVLFVISAGNDAVDNTTVPHYPCDYDPSTSSIAGAIDNVICVAAIDRNDDLASFSDYSATTVDLGAPGTEILSTFPHEVLFADNFEGPLTWTATTGAGFAPASDGPLTTNGLSDSPGAAPVASSTVASTSAGISIPAGEGGCTFAGQRFVRLEGGSFSYEILNDGGSIFLNSPADTAGSALVSFHTVPITGLGGHTAQIRFTYTTGATPTADGGVWIDNTVFDCITAVTATTGYGILEGTSMAAPQVTGAAALLFSLKPAATVTEVRQALLSNTTPDPSLAGKTTTGGRLDVSRAIDALVPPDTAIAAAPQDPTSATTATFTFTRADSTTAAATFECQIDGAAFAPCASPASFPVAAGTHTFAVRAISPHGEIDPTPATKTWTVVALPQPPSSSTTAQAPPPPTTATTATTTTTTTSGPRPPKPKPTPTNVVCKVPRLTGKTLGSATSALRKAHCALGSVKKPKRHSGRRLVVTSSSPPAGRTRPKGTKVKLTLGPARPARHRA